MMRTLLLAVLVLFSASALAAPRRAPTKPRRDAPRQTPNPAPKDTSPKTSDKDKDPKKKSPNAGRKVVVERVVAIVNDAIILASELDARMVPVRAEANQIQDPKERERRLVKLTSQVLDEMVNEELIVQAAEAAKVEVEASEVQTALDEIKSSNNLDDAGLAQVLAAQGYNIANYKQELRRQLLRLRAQNQLVAPKVQITDEDVRAKYDQMQRRSESVSAVSLSHMLFKLPEHPDENQLKAAKEKAAKAVTRVKGGEDFSKVAAEISEDDSTKATGGALGWFQRGSMANPEWEPIVFAMEKGDVRGPISGPQGLHVFLVSEVKKTEVKSYQDLKEQLTRDLRRREMEKQTQTWIEELRKKAYIDIKLR
jgi:peptidyl-prolyl cis-trans isomerase SurA